MKEIGTTVASPLYAEREKRISDAIPLKKPDRVPVWGGLPGLFPTQHLGITREDQMMDIDKNLEASFQAACTSRATSSR
jgi:hypothetical protein